MDEDLENITDKDLMREFMRLSLAEIRPDEVTVNMFCSWMKVDRKKAAYALEKFTTRGFLKVRQVTVDGSNVNAYSPNNCTWKDVVEKMKQP